MSKTNHWMPFYIGDYLADTMGLTLEQHGAYLLLLMTYWRSGPLPNSDQKLAQIVNVSRTRFAAKIAPVLPRFFTVSDDGFLHQKRMDDERSRTVSISEKRRETALLQHNKETKAGASAGASAGANGGAKTGAKEVQTRVQTECKTGGIAGAQQPQPQPQSKIDLPSVGQGGALGEDEKKAISTDPKADLFREGGAILRALTNSTERRVGGLIARMLKLINEDCDALLAILREAALAQPENPAGWIKTAITNHVGIVGEGQIDRWGINAWAKRQRDMVLGLNRQHEMEPLINGNMVITSAEMLADAIGLPETWRGNWDAFGAWLREDLDFLDAKVLTALADQAWRMGGDIRSMAVFDQTVRMLAQRFAA